MADWYAKGDKGDQGAQGLQGVKGDKGDKGDQGAQGLQGVKGDTGLQGIQGVKGDTGAQGVKGDTGLQGIQGVKGDTGDTGPANSLEIGTVTGGATAGATITGSAPTQTLNLTLPKGDTGEKGDKGDTGAPGGGLPPGSSWDDKQDFIVLGTSAQYYRGDKTWATLDKAAVGLGNVDNTADTSKPISTAQQTALNAKQSTSAKNTANGYAGLDASGLIPSSLLPSYVDDVLEYANLAGFPGTGEAGKIYTALDTFKIYRWSGSAYVEISQSPGSTDSVTEGSVNLYYTQARTDARVTAGLTGRTLTAGTGLSGGGTLAADRSFSLSSGTQASLAKADGSVQKVSTPSILYGTDGSGAQGVMYVAYGQTGGDDQYTVSLRDDNGRLQSAAGAIGLDVVNMNQLTAAQLVTVDTYTSSQTLALTNGGHTVEFDSASAVNCTIPLNSAVAFPIGTVIEVLQVGAGRVTIVPTGGVSSNNASGLKTRAQWSSLFLRKRGTDAWVVTGDSAT